MHARTPFALTDTEFSAKRSNGEGGVAGVHKSRKKTGPFWCMSYSESYGVYLANVTKQEREMEGEREREICKGRCAICKQKSHTTTQNHSV